MIPRSKIVAVVIGCSYFMFNLDGTIVATALPQIAASIGDSPVRLNVVITGYLLSLAIFIPISGWLADRFGAQTIFLIAIAIFTISSALCGLSSTVWELTVARVLQGMASAMFVPVGRLVLLRTVRRSDLVNATAFLTVPSQIGSVIGPVLGGVIAVYASWRWIFLINIPVGILGIVLAMKYIENFREAERRRLDWIGFLLTAVSLSLVLYALEALGRGTAPLDVVGLLLGGMAAGLIAVRHMARIAHPIVDARLLRIPTFSVNVWGGSLFRVGWGGSPFLLPLMFQVVFGMDALSSGVLVLGSSIGSVAIRIAGPALIRRFGFRRLLVWNGMIGALTVLACGLLRSSLPFSAAFAVLLIGGGLQALQITALNSIAYADIETRQMSSATSIGQLTQQVSKALGVAAAALLLHTSLNWRGTTQLSDLDFLVAFAGIAAVSAVSVPFFMRLPPDAGSEISGHGERSN